MVAWRSGRFVSPGRGEFSLPVGGCWGGIPFPTAGAAADLRGATRAGQLSVVCRDWT